MTAAQTLRKNFLPAALLTAAVALAAALIVRAEPPGLVILSYADRGWALLYGLKHDMVGFNMPLLSVLMTFIDYEPRRLALAVNAVFILLFFSAYNLGSLKGGRLNGALYAFIAALISFSRSAPADPEQVFFTLLIAVYLNVEAARETRPGPVKSFLAGLALGGTLLVRSTLFLFPLVLAALEFLRGGRSRKIVLKEIIFFIAGAYLLLAPWARLNYFISRRFIPFENGRAATNIITGSVGSVYTMEGNSRSLAGIAPGDDVLEWAAGRVLSEPGAYLSAVIKRIWHVLKMFPLAFLLAALALLYLRKRADPVLAALCAYLVVMHCLVSVEERYFFPLVYLLGFLAADGLGAALSRGQDPRRPGARAAYGLFLPALAFILAVEYAVLAYPFKATEDYPAGVEAALKKKPDHPWLLMTRAETLIRSGRTEEGLNALRTAAGKAGGKKYSDSAEVLRIMDSSMPAAISASFMSDYSAPLFIALRELELGRNEEAGRSLTDAWLKWNRGANMLRGTPYERDRSVLLDLRRKNTDFQDRIVYDALLYWPPDKRGAIMSGLEKLLPLSDKLELLKFLSVIPKAGAGRCEYGRAAGETAKALLSAKCAAFAGGPREDAVELLEAGKTDLKTAASFNYGPPGEAETRCLADICSGRAARTAASLRRLHPSEPFYLVLALEAAAGGKAGRAGVIKSAGEPPGLLLEAADLYVGRGCKDKAVDLAAAALGSPGLARDGLRRAAFLLQDAGRYREALAALGRAAAGPGDWKAHNDIGVIYMLLGDRKAAERSFMAALAAAPDSWEVRLNLAALRRGGGRHRRSAIPGPVSRP